MPSATHKKLSIEELKTVVAPVAEKYGVDRVYLFGSVARGDCDENSDYDFYIEKGKIRSAIILSEFFLDLRDAVGSEIDLISTRSVRPELMNRIMEEKVLIYG